MLLKADDKLVPKFLQALKETEKHHVKDILAPGSMSTSAVLY